MRYVFGEILIIFWLVFIFIFVTACTPNRITRGNGVNYNDQKYVEDSEFSYDNFGEDNPNELNRDKKMSRHMERTPRNSNRHSNESESMEDESFFNQGDAIPKRERFYQKGLASWYGREFHGKITASGERFNMNELTAAHKTLPFGTILIVRNINNGKSVKVIVNDRGPYSEGRILDLSYAAARRLGMISNGETMVGIRIIRTGKDDEYSNRRSSVDEIAPVAGDSIREEGYYKEDRFIDDSISSRYSIQTGAFYSRRNAKILKRRLEELFNNPIILIREDDMYKVRIEGVRTKGEVIRYKRILEEEEIPCFLQYNKRE